MFAKKFQKPQNTVALKDFETLCQSEQKKYNQKFINIIFHIIYNECIDLYETTMQNINQWLFISTFKEWGDSQRETIPWFTSINHFLCFFLALLCCLCFALHQIIYGNFVIIFCIIYWNIYTFSLAIFAIVVKGISTVFHESYFAILILFLRNKRKNVDLNGLRFMRFFWWF